MYPTIDFRYPVEGKFLNTQLILDTLSKEIFRVLYPTVDFGYHVERNVRVHCTQQLSLDTLSKESFSIPN